MGFCASFSPSLVEADRDCLMSQDRAVTLAVIIGAHGVTGEVRLKLFSDDPARLKQYKVFAAAGRTLTLKNIRAGNNGAIARFAEITEDRKRVVEGKSVAGRVILG